MTIIQLEYLLAVANCGSFSLAAEHCFVTQPSLSMQVKALEEELGVVLLDRSKKPVIPTEAGEVVLEQARETIKAYNYINTCHPAGRTYVRARPFSFGGVFLVFLEEGGRDMPLAKGSAASGNSSYKTCWRKKKRDDQSVSRKG